MRAAFRDLSVSRETGTSPSEKWSALSRVLDSNGWGLAVQQQISRSCQLSPNCTLNLTVYLHLPPSLSHHYSPPLAVCGSLLMGPPASSLAPIIHSPWMARGILKILKRSCHLPSYKTLQKLSIKLIMTSKTLTWPKTPNTTGSSWPLQPPSTHPPLTHALLFTSWTCQALALALPPSWDALPCLQNVQPDSDCFFLGHFLPCYPMLFFYSP